MEPKINSSFIPKSPISHEEASRRRGRSMGLVTSFLLIIVVVAMGLALGLYAYKSFILESNLARKSTALEKTRGQFSSAQIQELQRLDNRFVISEQLLRQHLAPSLLFSLLESMTLRTVQFLEFNYRLLPDGRAAISIKGIARSFSSLALQSDILSREPAIREPIFSKLDLDQFGNATFNFDALVDTGALAYRNLVTESTVSIPVLLEEDGQNLDEVGATSSPSLPSSEPASSSPLNP